MPTQKDHYSGFVAKALMLRTQHAYRVERSRAKDYDIDVSEHPEPHSYEELRLQYEDLLAEYASERPDTPHQILANLDLVVAIISDELCGRYREEGGIVASERDLGYALELLGATHSWLNKLDIAEAVAAERDRLGRAAPNDNGDAASPPDAGTRQALRELVDRWDAEAGGDDGDAA